MLFFFFLGGGGLVHICACAESVRRDSSLKLATLNLGLSKLAGHCRSGFRCSDPSDVLIDVTQNAGFLTAAQQQRRVKRRLLPRRYLDAFFLPSDNLCQAPALSASRLHVKRPAEIRCPAGPRGLKPIATDGKSAPGFLQSNGSTAELTETQHQFRCSGCKTPCRGCCTGSIWLSFAATASSTNKAAVCDPWNLSRKCGPVFDMAVGGRHTY